MLLQRGLLPACLQFCRGESISVLVGNMCFHTADLRKVPMCVCVYMRGPYVTVPLGVGIGWKCTCMCLQSVLMCSSKYVYLGMSLSGHEATFENLCTRGKETEGIWLFTCISHFYSGLQGISSTAILLPIHPHFSTP